MGPNRGPNRAGISGIVHLPGLGSGVQFRADLGRWKQRLDGTERERRGRGGGRFRTARWMTSAGTGWGAGELQESGWPAPSSWEGQHGTITIQVMEGREIAYPIMVTAAEIVFGVEGDDFPKITFAWSITGSPTYTGWPGTQPTATTPAQSDQVQWPGSAKSIDPSGLQTTAQRTIDIWGTLTDSDAAEQTKLAAVISAALPPLTTPHNAKLRSSVYTRDAIDGGTIVETWGLTTTAEDQENVGTFHKVDPNGLGSVSQLTLLDQTPAVPAGLVSRGVTTRELNDSHNALTLEAGRRSTVDDHEMDGSHRADDPLDLESAAADTVVYDTAGGIPTAPALPLPELQLVSTRTQEIDRVASRATFGWDILNSAQKQTFPRIKTTDDAENIEDEAVRAQVWNTTVGAPGSPTDAPANNVKLVTFTDVPLAPATATIPAKWVRVWLYGPRNSRDQVVLPEVQTIADASSIAATALRAGLDGETITDPSGYVLRLTRTIPITEGLGVDRTLTVKVYGLRTTAQDTTMPGTWTDLDPLAIESQAKDTAIYTTSGGEPIDPAAPSAELQLVGKKIHVVNSIVSQREVEFKVLNSEQERSYPRIKTTDDAHNLEDEAVRAEFWDVGGVAPATPTDAPANNVKLVAFTDVPITPARNMRVWLYGPHSSRDKAVLPHVQTDTDPDGLESTAIRAGLDGETINDPAGYVHRGTISRELTVSLGVNRTLSIKKYGTRSTVDDVEMPETVVRTDATNLDHGGRDTQVWTTAGAAPAAPVVSLPTDAKVVHYRDQELNRTYSKRTFELGMRTPKEEIEWLRSRQHTEAGQLRREVHVVEVTASATPDATADNPDATNLSLFDSQSNRLTTGQYVHQHRFRPLTAQEELEEEGTLQVVDPTAFLVAGNRWRQVTATTTPPADPTPTAGGTVVKQRTMKRVGKSRYRWDWEFGYRDGAADLEAARTRTAIDPQGLEDERFTADVWEVALGEPLDPAAPAAGLKLAEKLDLTTPNPAYTLRVYRWALLDSADRITFPASPGEANPFGDDRDSAELVASTDTIADLLAAERVAMQGDVTWGRTRIRRLNDAKILRIRTVRGDEYGVRARFFESIEAVRSRFGLVQVSQAIARGAGSTDCFINGQIAVRIRGEIIIYRHMLGANLFDVEQFGLIGDTNNDPFLGHGAGKIKYTGPKDIVGHVRDSTSRTWDVAYGFAYDSLEHVEDHMVQLGWTWVAATISKGYSSPAPFGWAIDYPPKVDFSVFLPPVTP